MESQKFLAVSIVVAVLSLLPPCYGDTNPPAISPVKTCWTQRYNDNDDYAKDIAIDSAGNVYVTGYAINAGINYDFVTIKYAPGGTVAWTKTYHYNPSHAGYVQALAIDSNPNVIIAGYGYNGASTGWDGIIIKYSSGGSQLWTAAYNFSGKSNDRFYDVATDSAGNIYAVGETDSNALIVKYTPDGNVA